MLTKYKKSGNIIRDEKVWKDNLHNNCFFVICNSSLFFCKIFIAIKYMDDDEMFLYGFALFGVTCAIVMLRIFLIDIFDIWRKKKK